MKVVILAGGSGTRLWPLSQRELPKQFVSLDGEQSLLEKTCARFDDPWVITAPKYAHLIQGKVVVEPAPRNTGPAILYAVSQLAENEDDLFCFCPVDHHFDDESALHRAIAIAAEKARAGSIALLGSKPTRAERKYGYILPDQSFVEKPKDPKPLITQGALWNVGIFLFTAKTLREEVEKHIPMIEPLSFDRLLLEKTDRITVTPLETSWRDIGSWDAIYDMLEKDEENNAVRGNVQCCNSNNNLVIGGKKPLYLIGIDDCIIVQGPEGILVAKQDEADKIKALLDRREKSNAK